MRFNEEEKERAFILSHIPNNRMTDEEFEEWTKICKKAGKPKPSREFGARSKYEFSGLYVKDENGEYVLGPKAFEKNKPQSTTNK